MLLIGATDIPATQIYEFSINEIVRSADEMDTSKLNPLLFGCSFPSLKKTFVKTPNNHVKTVRCSFKLTDGLLTIPYRCQK